jgi:hypothetical protein
MNYCNCFPDGVQWVVNRLKALEHEKLATKIEMEYLELEFQRQKQMQVIRESGGEVLGDFSMFGYRARDDKDKEEMSGEIKPTSYDHLMIP